jgi:type II secretory pathway component HofQ
MAEDPKQLYQEAMTASQAGNFAEARLMFEAVLAVQPGNQTARRQLELVTRKQEEAERLERSLNAIVLEKVEFNDVSAREAMNFVSQQVKKATDGKQPVNILWTVPGDQDPKVTLSLSSIPAGRAMRYIAENAGLQIVFDVSAVKVSVPR